MDSRLLGGLTARVFLRRHWQKCPLFVRRAFPAPLRLLDERSLTALAKRDDVESRIVERHGDRWNTLHGPFQEKFHAKRKNWTLLVSGVNLHLAAADGLLRCFDFVPQARLDDVMVSFATPRGGVGPHVDSYDVFLVQGPGRRRWRIWNSKGQVSNYLAEPGDLLYLPPGWRHDGVALEPCFTYSIGFRAPRGAELGAAFLDWLHERGLPDAAYRDAGLSPMKNTGLIPRELVEFATGMLRRIRWSHTDVQRLLGEYLTLPKAHVVFKPARAPSRPAPPARGGSVVRLDPKTHLLYRGNRFFMNGDTVTATGRDARWLRRLADQRRARGAPAGRKRLARLVRGWQKLGYLRFERP
jgi:50S ribosomal protein L16 3-hydroxylase